MTWGCFSTLDSVSVCFDLSPCETSVKEYDGGDIPATMKKNDVILASSADLSVLA